MRTDVLWELTSEKVREELKKGQRQSKRELDEGREAKLEVGKMENAHGSCRVWLGKTQVIAGVMLQLGTPYPDTPDEGSISVGVELMPMASPTFEEGPPREDATELARVVDRCIREGKAVDFKKLKIADSNSAWVAFIDVYVGDYDGNLFDACAIASLGALLNTRMPKLEKKEDGLKVVKGEFHGKLPVDRLPILTTFAKIGDKILLDPDQAEEKAMEARLSVATTEDGYISALQKGGRGHFSEKEVNGMLETAFEKAKAWRKSVKS